MIFAHSDWKRVSKSNAKFTGKKVKCRLLDLTPSHRTTPHCLAEGRGHVHGVRWHWSVSPSEQLPRPTSLLQTAMWQAPTHQHRPWPCRRDMAEWHGQRARASCREAAVYATIVTYWVSWAFAWGRGVLIGGVTEAAESRAGVRRCEPKVNGEALRLRRGAALAWRRNLLRVNKIESETCVYCLWAKPYLYKDFGVPLKRCLL
jgi:hypothetical protein